VKKLLNLLTICLIIFLFSQLSKAQDSLNISTISTMYGHSGYIVRTEIIDNYAYTIPSRHERSSTVGIFDISDPRHFVPMGCFRHFENIEHFVQNGTIAIVTFESDSIFVFDITDRTSPELLSSFMIDSEFSQVEIDGDLLFVRTALNWGTIHIIDLSDLENPEQIHEQNQMPGHFAVGNNILAIDDDEDNVDIYDISDLENFILTGTFPYRNPYRMQIDGDRLYVRSLTIYDISNPAEPFLAGEYGVSSSYVIWDTLLFEEDEGISIHNIADVNNMREIGFASMQNNHFGTLAVGSDIAILIDIYIGLGIYDISDLTAPDSVCLFWYPEWINNVAYSNNHLFIGDNQGLRIVEVNDPANPVEISTFYTGRGGEGYETIIDGNTAFVNADFPIYILDISDLENPYPVSTCRTCCAVDDIAYYSNPDIGDLIIESGLHGEMEIFDVTDRSNPRSIYNSMNDDIENINGSVCVDGDYLYWIGSVQGLMIYNLADEDADWPLATFVSDRWAPYGNYLYADFGDILVHDGVAYISEVNQHQHRSGLCLVDISDPENPEEILFTDEFGFPREITACDNHLIFSSYNEGVTIVDYRDSENPIITGRYSDARHAIIEGDIGYFTGDFLTIVDCSEALTDNAVGKYENDQLPHIWEIAKVFPNPFNPNTTIRIGLPRDAQLNISAYNILGQKIASLAAGKYSAGYHDFVLNGSVLPSGIYFIHASVPGKIDEMKKVVLMK